MERLNPRRRKDALPADGCGAPGNPPAGPARGGRPAPWAWRLRALAGDDTLWRTALTHPSYAHEHPDDPAGSNQRLEHLGDAVLDLIVTETLFRRFPDRSEGELTRWRAALVAEPTLAQAAQRAGLDRLARLGRGEEATGGRQRASVLAALLEAAIGAAYLGSGLEPVRAWVLELFEPLLAALPGEAILGDYKTPLQEWAQARRLAVAYAVLAEEGPLHARRYRVAVLVGGSPAGEGRGPSIKEAEQAAAREALARLGGPRNAPGSPTD